MNIYGKLLLLKNMELKDVSLENVGVISGRDAMVITGIRCDDPLKIEVTCSVTSQACSEYRNRIPATYFTIKFVFKQVIMFQTGMDEMCGRDISDEEFTMYADSESAACVQEIMGSPLATQNSNKKGFSDLKHFVITAYDYTIEVVYGKLEVVICDIVCQLKKQLKDILEVLERSEEKIWRKVFESYLSDLDVLDIEEMKRNIRGIYGGNGFI
ncbi:MAG: hypothetical protein LUH15_11150 [Tannerellaceae bacterium]|nr:hypothetical protein [Tannerellaceae bacterium]